MGEPKTAPSRLEVSGLDLVVGSRRLLTGVELVLGAGEALALRGPSGCGKSTLLRALCFLEDPAGGRIRFEGREPGAGGWPAYRRAMLYLPQVPYLPPSPVPRVLEEPFSWASNQESFPASRARELLEEVGLGDVAEAEDCSRLSVGERQRLALVRGLLLGPRVLLLDEPTSGLDPQGVRVVEALLTRVRREEGTSLLVVTHDPAQAARLEAREVDLTCWVPEAIPGGGEAA